MSNGQILEIASLSGRHPVFGTSMVYNYAAETVYMLLGAVELPEDRQYQTIEVDLKRDTELSSEIHTLSIGWSDIPELPTRLPAIGLGLGEKNEPTQHAAVVVMALLISALESGILHSRVTYGNGPDYWVDVQSRRFVIEASGVGINRNSATHKCLEKKKFQVLRNYDCGYVSVTTFNCPQRYGLRHSYLHFVRNDKKVVKKMGKSKHIKKSQIVDPDGSITRAMIEAEGAIARGDTDESRVQYGIVGKSLLKKARSVLRTRDKHFLRYLAARRFFDGGDYKTAMLIIPTIEIPLLPSDIRNECIAFRKKAQERSRNEYPQATRDLFKYLFESRQFDRILQLFRDHPYVMLPTVMAMFRSLLCAELKNYAASVSFMISAMKFGFQPHITANTREDVFFQMACFPLISSTKGDFEGAWKHVQTAVRLAPKHAAYYISGTSILYLAGYRESGPNRLIWAERLVDYAKKAWQLLPEATNEFRNNKEVKLFIDGMLVNTIIASEWLGDERTREWAKNILDKRGLSTPVFRSMYEQIKSIPKSMNGREEIERNIASEYEKMYKENAEKFNKNLNEELQPEITT